MANLLSVIQAARRGEDIPRDEERRGPLLHPLLASVMLANAEMGAAGAAKKVDEAAAAAPSPEISIKKAPTGEAMFTAKNVPMLNRDNVKAQAMNEPREQVSSALEQFGYRLPDPEDAEKDTRSFSGAYRASRQMGNERGPALVQAALMRSGLVNRDPFVRELVNLRAGTQDQVFRQNVKPHIDEAQQVAREERIINKEEDARRDREEKEARSADIHSWKEFRTLPLPHMGSVDEVLKLAGDSGFKLTEERTNAIRAIYARQQSAIKDAREDQARQERAAERADRRFAMAIKAKDTEKPFKLTAFHAANVTTGQLIAGFEDPGIDQQSLRQAASSRVGRLGEEVEAAERGIAKASETISTLEKLPGARVNQFTQTRIADLRGDLKANQLKKEQASADLKKLTDALGTGAIEYVSQQEWNDLLGTGETADSLNKQGIFLKRKK